MKIWRCEGCGSGIRAPERLARLDVRRWCLPCSKRTGQLTERTVPSKDAARSRRADARSVRTRRREERRVASAASARRREAALAASTDRPHADGAAWLRAWAPRVVALSSLQDAFREHHPGRRWAPRIVIRQSGTTMVRVTDPSLGVFDEERRIPRRHHASGHAYLWEHRVVVTTGASAADDLSTLVHELAHLAAPDREVHGPLFQVIQRDAIAELTGEAPVGWRRHGDDSRVTVIQRWLDRQRAASRELDPAGDPQGREGAAWPT